MKVLILGGSFNPIHLGHLIMAQELRLQFGYDRVLMVPSLRPPHKELTVDPGSQHRLAMLALAIAGDPFAEIDDCEIRRGGTSFTIDTVREIAQREGVEGKPGLVLGDDLVPGFPMWREPGVLASEAELICAHRSTAERLSFGFPHRYGDNPLIPISSSLVRERARSGLPFRYLVPAAVHGYIIENRLYGIS